MTLAQLKWIKDAAKHYDAWSVPALINALSGWEFKSRSQVFELVRLMRNDDKYSAIYKTDMR